MNIVNIVQGSALLCSMCKGSKDQRIKATHEYIGDNELIETDQRRPFDMM